MRLARAAGFAEAIARAALEAGRRLVEMGHHADDARAVQAAIRGLGP